MVCSSHQGRDSVYKLVIEGEVADLSGYDVVPEDGVYTMVCDDGGVMEWIEVEEEYLIDSDDDVYDQLSQILG